MILKKESKKKINFNINKFLFIYFLSTILVGIILLIFVFKSQTFAQVQSKYLNYLSEGGRIEYLYLPKIVFKSLKSKFNKLEKIDLEIKFDNSIVLENTRNEAIKNGTLPKTELNPEVNFNLIYNDKKYSGGVRLKGDRLAHFLERKKSSYKIKLDKNQYIFGIKKFSLQKPRIRNYAHEWIYHQMSKDFDLIKIKYEFLNLSINGEDKGLYVLEEGFGKELIERNKRRNGPIFGVNEDLTSTLEIKENSEKIVFEIYNKKYWSKKENRSLVNIASQKLRDFLNRKIPAEDVLDLKKWAAYFAIIDMTGTYHGALIKSVKFYYNPINGLFEPIPFDGHRLKGNYHKYLKHYDNRILIDMIKNPKMREEISAYSWLRLIFLKKNGDLNEYFYSLYIKNLDVVSSKEYLDNFIDENLSTIEKINSHIYADYFYFDNARNYGSGIYYFLLSDFYHQAKNIRNKIEENKRIHIIKKNNYEFLIKDMPKKNSLNYTPLFVDTIICNKDNQDLIIEVKKNLNSFSDTSIKLPAEQMKNVRCTHINFINKINKEKILLKIDHLNSKHSYRSFKNIEVDLLDLYFIKKDNQLLLIRDEIKIEQNIYIPKGYKVIVKPGQKILLTNNAFIISNSSWIIGGKGKQTIISGEKNNLGGGIIIGDNNEMSKIQNTKISYLKGYNGSLNSEHLIMGSINFHQTNVEIDNVNFENIFSEDAINIIRSNFKINNSSYKNISSDAIDIDFSDGKIEHVSFKNIKNDAMDFSGSNVDIYDSYFDNVNDKLISGGEKSNIKISKINALNSKAGIISKDGSKVYSDNIFFENVKIPFAAYQKKREYNHSLLVVKDFKISNFLIKFAKDKKSKIILNDLVQVNTKNNKKMLSIVN